MTCREVVEFLMEYLSGELPADQHAAFQEHLQACAECIAYVKSYEETVKLARLAGSDPDVADDVPEELVQAILAARKPHQR